MPKYVVPASYTSGRKQTLAGTVYNPGDTIPNAVVKGLKDLSALLSNREIIPNVDPHSRRTKVSTPTPTDVPPVVRKSM